MNKLEIWRQMFNSIKIEAWQLKPDTKTVIWGTLRSVQYVELCDGHGNHKLQFTRSWGGQSVPALRIVFNDGHEIIVHPKCKIRCAAEIQAIATGGIPDAKPTFNRDTRIAG
jgi:hypothetical protein